MSRSCHAVCHTWSHIEKESYCGFEASKHHVKPFTTSVQKTATAEATVKKRHAYVPMTRKTAIGIWTLLCQRLVVGGPTRKKIWFLMENGRIKFHVAELGQRRSSLGQKRLKARNKWSSGGQKWLSLGPKDLRQWPKLLSWGSNEPEIIELGPGMAEPGPEMDDLRPNIPNLKPIMAKLRPKMAKLGPKTTELGPIMAKLGPKVT